MTRLFVYVDAGPIDSPPKRFTIPKDLLCRYPGFFKECFRNGMKESVDNKVVPEDEDPAPFSPLRHVSVSRPSVNAVKLDWPNLILSLANFLHCLSDLFEPHGEIYEANSCNLRWLYTGTILEHKETI